MLYYANKKEISVDTYTENRVLPGASRFINNDPVSTKEESLKSSEAVHRTSSENKIVNFGINKTNRLVVLTIQVLYRQKLLREEKVAEVARFCSQL